MRIGIIAGEASGDLLGAGLIRRIKARFPDAHCEGVAGPAMLAEGCEALADAEELAVMGLIEPLKEIPRLLRLRRRLLRHWRSNRPDVFVGIDAPDFNLGVELRLRRAGIPTAHYVSPSVWAWRSGRIKTIRRACDRVLCLLPFEKRFYDEHGVDAVFVGHPKATELTPDFDQAAIRAEHGMRRDGPLVALLPGSRGSEVERLADVFAKAAELLHRDSNECRFVLPVATPKLRPTIVRALAQAGIEAETRLLDGGSLDAMRAADVVLLASGTAVLEAALLGKPVVAAYRVAPFTARLIRTFGLIKVQHFTLPNLLTEEPLVPEFIQEAASPENLAASVASLLDDSERRAGIRDSFAKLRERLALDADERAAAAVLELVRRV
ncbi:MAG: lipid-A-disaccharide synthase [Pseudomonadota bacterium]